MITIRVIDNATPAFNRMLQEARNPRQLLLAAGRAVANLLKRHYTEVNAREPNQLGAKRTNFWLQIKRAVQAPVTTSPNSVTVSISHPAIRQKVLGGEITAKRRKSLTIPVSREAYGRTASTYEHETGLKLFAIVTGGRGVLASKDAAGHLTVQYLLLRSVHQKPDPNALPATSEITQVALDIMRKTLARQHATN